MFWLILCLLILVFLLILILFTKLTIILNYHHHNHNDDVKVEFKIWFGLIKYKLKVPLIKIDDDTPSVVVKSKSQTQMGETAEKTDSAVNQMTHKDFLSSLQNSKEIMKKVFNLHLIVKKFLRKVTIKKFEWHSLMGVGDAAHTGMMTGALWALKGSILGLVSHYIRLKVKPNITVTPHFQAAVIQTRFTCIFQFRIGHAILAGLKLIKFWKGGKPHLKNKTDFPGEKTKSV